MAKPSTRQGLIDYCFRKLGAPVLEVNVDDDQVDDLLDDTQFAAGCWGFSAHHLDLTAVLLAVVLDVFDLALLIEIYRDNFLLDDGLLQEGPLLNPSSNIVPNLFVEGTDGGRRS